MRKTVASWLSIFCLSYSLQCGAQVQSPSAASPSLQDNASQPGHLPIQDFPSSFIDKIRKKADAMNRSIERQTEKAMNRLVRREEKLKKRLYKLDSNATRNLFLSDAGKQYAGMAAAMKTDTGSAGRRGGGEYLPYADSLQGALSFLQKDPAALSGLKGLSGAGTGLGLGAGTGLGSGAGLGVGGGLGAGLASGVESGAVPENLRQSLQELQQLQARLQDGEAIKNAIRERKEQIRQYLLQFSHLPKGVTDLYQDYNKELYYYNAQLAQYKASLNDPDELAKKALAILDKMPVFQDFMRSHSILSGLFPMPPNYGTAQALTGLQTRDQINQIIGPQLSSGPNAQGAFSQGLQSGQAQLDQLKDKILQNGSGGGDIDIPDFKPNQQKTKSFLKRLELGMDLQTQHSTYYFPTTTDLGLSVGYKLNNRNTVGVGASYKIGWGADISHVRVSGQGAGLRSFLDYEFRKDFLLSGLFEYNYQPPTISGQSSIVLPSPGQWQRSGMIGLSKVVSTNARMLKKTKLQVLWDFLSYSQAPRGQPFKFRVGYTL